MKVAENTLALAARHRLTLTRVFDAPRERVFQAWTEPEHLALWWGAEGSALLVCEVDVRPGGAIRMSMWGADGTAHPMKGVYMEIVPPRRIVFVASPLDGEDKPLFKALITVTLSARDGRTRLALRARVIKATAVAAPHLADWEMGWAQCLARLAALLARPADR